MRFVLLRHGDPGVGERLAGEVPISRDGVRVELRAGRRTLIESPLPAATAELSGMVTLETGSRSEAIDWVLGQPTLAGRDGEIEIRESGCPGGLPGVDEADASPQGSERRFLVLLKSAALEEGFVPDEALLAPMALTNDEAVRRGAMVAGEGLLPSRLGARVKLGGGRPPAVVDGPFAEAKELIAGYWLLAVDSRQDAVDWVMSYPFPVDDAEVEIRESVS